MITIKTVELNYDKITWLIFSIHVPSYEGRKGMLRINLFSKKGLGVLALLLFFGAIFFWSINSALAGPPCEGNFDFDPDVDGSDLAVFAADFGRTDCPPKGPAPVEKTGQTTSYATGDDGDLGKGVAWPNPRLTDNLDGTITDNLTGLLWLQEVNCFGFRKWNLAIADSNGLASGSCGLTDGSNTGDWRLPTSFELESLGDMECYGPAISNTAGTGQWMEGDPFTSTQSSLYWSSTTVAAGADYAWSVDMDSGYARSIDKYAGLYIWPARGGH